MTQRARAFRVDRVEFLPIDEALTEPFAIASGAQARASNVLVVVELASGIRGIGEAAPFPAVSGETQASSLRALEVARSLVVGRDVRAIRALSGEIGEALGVERAAVAGIEAALLDALARAHGVSLTDWFGGVRATVRTDITITKGTVAHARASAESARARGIGTLKVKVGGSGVELEVERMLAIAATSPRALLVDANGGFTEAEAAEFLRALHARGVRLALFEEPVARGDVDAMARLAERGVPIAADESARTPRDVVELARAGAAAAVNLKTQKSGIFGALEIASVARSLGLELMIGGMVESEIGMTFSAHVASGLGGVRFVDLDTPFWFERAVTAEGYRVRGDEVLLDPEAPGLGLELAPHLRTSTTSSGSVSN